MYTASNKQIHFVNENLENGFVCLILLAQNCSHSKPKFMISIKLYLHTCTMHIAHCTMTIRCCASYNRHSASVFNIRLSGPKELIKSFKIWTQKNYKTIVQGGLNISNNMTNSDTNNKVAFLKCHIYLHTAFFIQKFFFIFLHLLLLCICFTWHIQYKHILLCPIL